MALNLPALEAGLESVASSPPATSAQCAEAWADAIESYTLLVVPTSTTVSVAAIALASDLLSAFDSGDAPPTMELALAQFATTVGGGMAGFTATPPPGPVGFAAEFAPPFPATHAAAAASVGALIDTWMRTGTATPSGGGAPVNWS